MKSLRGEIPDFYNYELNDQIRHKIIGTAFDHINSEPELYELVRLLERDLGRNISEERLLEKKIQDFLFKSTRDEFLTAIELLIAIKFKNRVHYPSDDDNLKSLIRTINSIFKIDKIGYEIVPAGLEDLPFIVVPYNSQYLHLETIKKPMSLMYDEDFKGPLNEFESALDKYRKSDYKDAIIGATKAYEGTLKKILQLKQIHYDSKVDKIPDFVSKIKSTLITDPNRPIQFNAVWEVLKSGPNTIRNQEDVGHGSPDEVTKIEKSYTDLVLRLVGTYIVFLIERYRETK